MGKENHEEICAQMHKKHNSREAPLNIQETLEQRIKTLNDFLKYITLIPLGKSNQEDLRLDLETRERIFNEKGCVCEACSKKIENNEFELHHINYFEGNNPEYLKVVCRPCHNVINMLTGMISWFEKETQESKHKKGQEESYSQLFRKVRIEDVDEETIN